MSEYTSGSILRVDRISHTKFSELDRAHTIVIATMSPLEVHGPHLPLGQDIFEAYAVAEGAAKLLVERLPQWTFLLLPPVPIAADGVPKLGSVNFPVTLVRDVAFNLMAPFARAGFARLAFSSFHGGPRHITALEDAADKLTKKFGVPAVSLFSVVVNQAAEGDFLFEGVKDTPGRVVTPEELKKDHHAGFLETSMALALWPDLVDDGWEDLPECVAEAEYSAGEANDSFLYGYQDDPTVAERMKRSVASVRSIVRSLKHFNHNTYYGYPSMASAAQGKDMYSYLSEYCAKTVSEFIEKGRNMNVHSPLWKFRHLLLNQSMNKVAEDWLKLVPKPL